METTVVPPSAPTDPIAVPGDGSALVSWLPPPLAGSFAVTHYEVQSGTGGRSCVVVAPALSCRVGRLVNDVTYEFRVRALNGAGWGAWSALTRPVVPSAAPAGSIVISGSRGGRKVTVSGSISGMAFPAEVTPHVRTQGSHPYRSGAAVPVDSDGAFRWSRKTPAHQRLWAYVSSGSVRSNVIVLDPAGPTTGR